MAMVLVSIGIPFRKREDGVELWGQLRREDGPLNGYWEFPGGKIEADETPEMAMLREVEEETGHTFKHNKFELFSIKPYHYQDRSVMLYVFLLAAADSALSSNGWHKLTDWPQLNLLEANYPIVNELQQYFIGELDGTD